MQIYARNDRSNGFKPITIDAAFLYFDKITAFRDEIEFMYKDAQGIERELIGFFGEKPVVATYHDSDTLYDWEGFYVRVTRYFHGLSYCGTKLLYYSNSRNREGKSKPFWGVEVQGVIYAINYKK